MTSVTIAGRHRTWTLSPSSSTESDGRRESDEGRQQQTWTHMHESDASESEDEGEDNVYLARSASGSTDDPTASPPLPGQGDSAAWEQLMQCSPLPMQATAVWYQVDARPSPPGAPVTPPTHGEGSFRLAATPPRRAPEQDGLDQAPLRL